MTFRDDAEAQLQRAAALERENERLRDELAEAKAAEARALAEQAQARKHADAENKRESENERENERLRRQLDAARGPGLARRIGAKIATLRLREPTGNGGFWRAALVTWRIHAAVVVGFAIPALVHGGVPAYAWFGLVLGTPVIAASVLGVAWYLNRRTRGIAGGAAGVVIGVATSATILAPVIAAMNDNSMSKHGIGWVLLGMYASFVLLHITRAAQRRDLPLFVLPLLPALLFPIPTNLMIIAALGMLGQHLADPKSRSS